MRCWRVAVRGTEILISIGILQFVRVSYQLKIGFQKLVMDAERIVILIRYLVAISMTLVLAQYQPRAQDDAHQRLLLRVVLLPTPR